MQVPNTRAVCARAAACASRPSRDARRLLCALAAVSSLFAAQHADAAACSRAARQDATACAARRRRSRAGMGVSDALAASATLGQALSRRVELA
jgi:hypothetical protein